MYKKIRRNLHLKKADRVRSCSFLCFDTRVCVCVCVCVCVSVCVCVCMSLLRLAYCHLKKSLRAVMVTLFFVLIFSVVFVRWCDLTTDSFS